MDIKKHNKGREKTVRRKRFRIAVFTAVLLGIVLMVFRYFDFVSKTIYEESVSHLTEVFHQSDNMLRELTDKNLTYLHIWGENLQNTSSEDEIRNYIKNAQEDAGFLDFFFLLLLAAAFWIWHLPKKQIQDRIRRTRGKLDLQAVNQYTFLPECIRMMSTSSLEKYQLEYENLTWIRCDKRWIVLYFARQDFTMLIDKQGFTHGTANACLAFLKNKQEGR